MGKFTDYRPPPRKEPGLLGKAIASTVALVVWLLLSLLISIMIEWVGMVWFWPEQGAGHSQTVLTSDIVHLDARLYGHSLTIKHRVTDKVRSVMAWLDSQAGFKRLLSRSNPNDTISAIREWGGRYYLKAEPYLQAANTVAQTFVVRLTLIIFSLPIFLLTGIIGAVDGLVERDLRRWGGGRESSNVFNLAKRSVVPAFIGACVIYISLPFSTDPVLVLLPFALLLGLAVRIGFERLKKYF